MHLEYDLIDAAMAGDDRHAQQAMKELGITYQHATPQSLHDSWWFWNCENIPSNLPKYISEIKLDPIKCIGYGLTKEMAYKIANGKSKP